MKRTNPSSSSRRNSFQGEKYLYLTTTGWRSGFAREIEIWFTHHDGRFYVIAEYEASNWVQNIQACPQVKLRVANQEFLANARIISEERERDLLAVIQKLSREKYGWGDGLVVEIEPSPGVD